MTVTVHVSKVLSPATFKIRPLNGTSICAILEAGNAAALHKKLKVSSSHPVTKDGNVGIGTDNTGSRHLSGKFIDASIYEKFGHLRHFAHFDTAWNIFKDYPILGVGNSKFRFICHDEKYYNSEIYFTYERCSNHPHQVHLEILSEQGIVGYLIIIFTIFNILFNSFKIYRKTGDLIHLSSILFVLTFFIPLLPTGSFFSTFNGSIFWINFSLVHAFLNKPNY